VAEKVYKSAGWFGDRVKSPRCEQRKTQRDATQIGDFTTEANRSAG
jgi:hypothetical protein